MITNLDMNIYTLGIFTENIPHPSYYILQLAFTGENSGFRQKITVEGFFSTWTHVRILTVLKKRYTTSNLRILL